MITLLVDEAYAFDYLAILLLKVDKGFMQYKDIQDCLDFVRAQVGKETFDNIMSSGQFDKLYSANEVTFNAVDAAKEDKLLASEVDKTNYHRMLAKKELQKHFFGNNIQEVKIGYEKLK